MSLLPIKRRTGDIWNIADEMDRILDTWYRLPSTSIVREGLWHPTMDIYNRNGEIVVELELAGLKEKDVDVSVEEDHLIVEGTRSRSTEYKEGESYYSERAYGTFHRVVHLPVSVDTDKAKASFKDGLLVVTLPKKERERGKKIKLETNLEGV